MGHGLETSYRKKARHKAMLISAKFRCFFLSFFGGLVTWNPPEANGARGLVPEHVHGSVIFFRECKDTDTKR